MSAATRLRGISQDGDWNSWIEFFLEAIVEQARSNTERVRDILDLYERMKRRITDLTRSQHAILVLDTLFDRPVFQSSDFVQRSGIPKQTALPFLRKLREAGILHPLREQSGRRSAILAFREKHPWVRIVVRVLAREALVAAVLAGEIDLGLAYDMENSPRLHVVARSEQRVGAVVAPEHPLAARSAVRMTECLPFPLIVGERPMALRRATELMLPAAVELRPAVETSSIDLMKRVARIAPHVAILNLADVRMDLSDGTLCFVPLLETAAHQSIAVFHRAAGAPEVAVSVMAREIENVLLGAQM